MVLSINLLLFLFSRPLCRDSSVADSKSISSKLYALRAINIILFFLYIAALFKLKYLYQMLEVESLVKRIAYETAEEQNIELQSPLTHNIDLDKRSSSIVDQT